MKPAAADVSGGLDYNQMLRENLESAKLERAKQLDKAANSDRGNQWAAADDDIEIEGD